jgi:hypothetical protein
MRRLKPSCSPALGSLLICSALAWPVQGGILFDSDFLKDGLTAWHFDSQGMEEDAAPEAALAPMLPGEDSSTGRLYIDSSKGMLGFLPRGHAKLHRCVLIAYRTLARPEDIRNLTVRFSPDAINPALADSLGGLFALICYRDLRGLLQVARDTVDAHGEGARDLVAEALYRFTQMNPSDLDEGMQLTLEEKSQALGNLVGVGFVFISPLHAMVPGAPLLLPGLQCTGEYARKTLIVRAGDSVFYAGDTLELDAADTGYAPISWEWRRDAAKDAIGMGNPLRLALSSSDTGAHVFSVRIMNEEGTWAESGPLRLRVLPAVPLLIAGPVSGQVEEGSTARLSVQVKGTPPFRFHWYKDSSDLQDQQTGQLILENTAFYDQGSYRCMVTDRFGQSATSAPANLEVTRADGALTHDCQPGTFAFGIKAGVNLANFYRDNEPLATGSKRRLSFPLAGAFTNLKLLSRLFLQAEALITRKGCKYTFGSAHSSDVALDYLEFPLFLQGRLEHRLSGLTAGCYGGGYWALKLRADQQNDWGLWSGHSSRGYRATDAGVLGGLEIGYAGLLVDFRYTMGIADITPTSRPGTKTNGVFSASVGKSLAFASLRM